MAPGESFRRRKSKSDKVPFSRKKKQSKSLKKKIRDAERLLAKPDLPATVRVAQERMLDMLKGNLQEKAVQEREQKMIKKYKMVKFFEKRKITRKFKTCTKELKTCSDEERKELEEKLEEIKKMWNYVVYYPSDVKYISLFPPVPYDNIEVEQKQEDILKLITEKVSSGETEDASQHILHTSQEKKPRPFSSRRKVTLDNKRMTAKIAKIAKDSEDDDESNEKAERTGLIDDFFIDTKPDADAKKESEIKATDKSRLSHKGSQFALLGSTARSSSSRKSKRRDHYDEPKAKKAKQSR